MVKFRGVVEFKDGRTVEFETGTAALAEWELFAMRHGYPVNEGMPGMLGMLVIAHTALGVEEGFETWRATVSGVTMDETEDVPPTRAARSAAS